MLIIALSRENNKLQVREWRKKVREPNCIMVGVKSKDDRIKLEKEKLSTKICVCGNTELGLRVRPKAVTNEILTKHI